MKRKLNWSAIKNALYLHGLRLKRSPNHHQNAGYWIVKQDTNFFRGSTGWISNGDGGMTTERMLQAIQTAVDEELFSWIPE